MRNFLEPITMNESQRYTRTAMTLHWLIAILIILNVILALTDDFWPEGWERHVIDLHKSIGITVLGLAIARLLWRVTHRPPALPKSFPTLERGAAHAAHFLLYVLIFAIPLSGWAHDSAWVAAASHPMKLYFLVPWPRIGYFMALDPQTKDVLHTQLGELHTWLGYVLYVVLFAHVAGALKHEFIDRESVLRRMLPWGK
jgi:cytochrome b561